MPENAAFILVSNAFSERAESTQFMALAQELEHRGFKAIIAFPKLAKNNNPSRIKEAKALGLQLFSYSNRQELERVANREGITHAFVSSDGTVAGPFHSREDPRQFRIAGAVHISHAVFRNYEPYGDFYLYVSDWLLEWAIRKRRFARLPFRRGTKQVLVSALPHGLPELRATAFSFRHQLSIPIEATVIGRIGGFEEFDDRAAHSAILDLLDNDPNLFFIAANTRRFADHERIRYLEYVDRSQVGDFYEACDLLLNARLSGESFGFSIVEPLTMGKPVIGPHWVRNVFMDRHHVRLLQEFGLLYRSRSDLRRKILRNLEGDSPSPESLKALGRRFLVSTMTDRLLDISNNNAGLLLHSDYGFSSFKTASIL